VVRRLNAVRLPWRAPAESTGPAAAENRFNLTMHEDPANATGDAAPFSIICLSSQRWDAPLPTNRQQIMSRAADRGHQVLFVETADFLGKHLWQMGKRGDAAQARKLLAPARVAANVHVVQIANILPWSQRFRVFNRIDWRVGARLLRRAVRALPEPRVLWIYDPRGADAVGRFGEAFAVYDCVDDYQHQSGPARSRALVANLDLAAAARSRLVFATTKNLASRHERGDGRTHLVPNVGDYDHFAQAADRNIASDELRSCPRPVLGFAGNLVEAKVDFALLERLAHEFAEGTLLIVGPAEPGIRERMETLAGRQNVRWLGLRPYAALPEVVAAFDVALIPYRDNPYTRSVFPLKVFEYLAAGKSVVASGLPNVATLEPHVLLATGHDAFVSAIRLALARGAAGIEERVSLAAKNTWGHRTQRLLGLVAGELERGPGH
jgi:glycosyltransferase involved in cell wall biosynthesis